MSAGRWTPVKAAHPSPHVVYWARALTPRRRLTARRLGPGEWQWTLYEKPNIRSGGWTAAERGTSPTVVDARAAADQAAGG